VEVNRGEIISDRGGGAGGAEAASALGRSIDFDGSSRLRPATRNNCHGSILQS
jgi:hypothetical protein